MPSAARHVLGLLEAGDVEALRRLFSPRLRGFEAAGGWTLDQHLRDLWHPVLEDLTGPTRQVLSEVDVSPTLARFVLEGERGRAHAVIRFLESGELDGFSVSGHPNQGLATVVVECAPEQRDELRRFYRSLIGEDFRRLPGFSFGARRYTPPQWPHPERPAQLHFDILVPDVAEAEVDVLAAGATVLLDAGDHRVYADPAGHPLCLYPDPAVAAGRPVLGRIVLDCFSPRALAAFWQQLLDLPQRPLDTAERVVIADVDATLPMLAFQHIPRYQAPRWPDPRFPQQMHFDLKFDDRPAAEALAERLGAIRLPSQAGSCPVYADPAGHPFCLCYPGE